MIPILYKKSDTNYTRNGAGFLSDIVSCSVTEERNGAYELAFTYPLTGIHYGEIAEGDVIKAKSNETSDLQLFRIYSASKPLNGIVSFKAEHISYDLNGVPLAGLAARSQTPQAAITRALQEGAFSNDFSAWSDISTLNSINLIEPCSVRAVLGGQRGSVLDVWGGEYEFDNFVIKLHAHRGTDSGVTIEYGKNLTDIKQEQNITDIYTHIFPYAVYKDETNDIDVVVTLSEKVLPLTAAGDIGHQKAYIINLSDKFTENETITEQKLRQKATSYAAAHSELGTPKVNIKASFVSLWQTEEYKSIAPLERVRLCDTVTVKFVKLGVSAKAKVIKTVYDTLKEKYSSIELGETRSSFADTVLDQNAAINELAGVVRKGFSDATEEIRAAIDEATALITGNAGGYIVLHPAERPQEILIMDTPDIETAVHVWRWNSSGLGYSSTGYNGTYGLAITMNGAIVADYITAGTLNGGLLRADSVQANAISSGFKQSIADDIAGAVSTVEQEFSTADEQLRSSITTSYTNAISASESRTQTLILQTRDSIMLDVYTKTETNTAIGNALGDYYTKSETNAQISASADAIMLGVYTKTETNTVIGNALTNYSTTTEMNSAITATATSITTEVNKKVNKTEFGTYMQQNYNSFLLGFNAASTTLQLTANGLTVYDGQITDNKKVFTLSQSGMGIYLDGDHVGNIGRSNFVGTTDHGLTFQLDTDGYYMMWSRMVNPSDTSYTAALTYTRGSMNGSFSDGEGIYISVPLYVESSMKVSGQATFNRAVNCDSTIAVTGSATFDGAVYARSSLQVSNSATLSSTLTVSGTTTLNGQLNMNDNIVMSSGERIKIANDYGIYCGDYSVLKWRNSGNIGVVSGNSNLKLYVEGTEIHMANRVFLDSPREIVFIGSDSYYHPLVKYDSGSWFGNDFGNTHIDAANDIGLHCVTVHSYGKILLHSDYSTSDAVIGCMFTSGTYREWIYADSDGYAHYNGTLHGSVATNSDSRMKESISPLNEKYLQVIKSIIPVSFKYKGDISQSGRTHTGFIAQDVLSAMKEAGLTDSDFAAFVDTKNNGEEYALRYEEFISPLLMYVRHLEERIRTLENERVG